MVDVQEMLEGKRKDKKRKNISSYKSLPFCGLKGTAVENHRSKEADCPNKRDLLQKTQHALPYRTEGYGRWAGKYWPGGLHVLPGLLP